MSGNDRDGQIMAAVLKILGAEGVQGLTTARIAGEVGFSEAALYKYFKNKEEIISGALDVMLEHLKKEKKLDKKRHGTPIDKILALYRNHVFILESQPGFYRLIYSDELHISSGKLKKKLKKIHNGFNKIVTSHIEDAKKEGLVRKDADEESVSLAISGCVQSAFMAHTVLEKKEGLGDMTMEMIQLVLGGIRVQNGAN